MSLSSDGVLLLSISRSDRFKKCARNFYYRYVLKLPEKQSYEAALGSRFHFVLDFWAKRFMNTTKLRESMVEAYIDAKKKWKKEKRRILSKDDLVVVKQWIKNYVALLERIKHPIVVLEHEKRFNFLIDGRYRIRGAIDRVDEIDKETIRIVDYKAGSSRFIDSKQVCVYAKALIDNPIYKGKKFIGTYIFVKEDCKVIEYDITDKLIEQTLKYLRETGEEIIIEKQWKPKFSPLCGWCSYKFQCAKDNNTLGAFECL